jgi:hypothetical protein
MASDIQKVTADDGTIDDDYTWGRPVTTYVMPHQHLRLLLLKGRVQDLRDSAGELRP